MKSVYIVLNEKLAALDTAGKRSQFDERAKTLTSVESKIACADFVLGIKESTPIKKNNGRQEEFRESTFREVDPKVKASQELREASDVAMYESLGISEADQRRLQGKPPAGLTLTPLQESEYAFAIACGIKPEVAEQMVQVKQKF